MHSMLKREQIKNMILKLIFSKCANNNYVLMLVIAVACRLSSDDSYDNNSLSISLDLILNDETSFVRRVRHCV